MGWLSALFSRDQIVTKTIDLIGTTARGIGQWIDEQQFTEQERAELRKEIMDRYMQFIEKAYDESGARTITRRILAVMIVSGFTATFLLGMVTYPLSPEFSKFLLDWIEATQFDWITITVIAFYFGIPFLREGQNGRKVFHSKGD